MRRSYLVWFAFPLWSSALIGGCGRTHVLDVPDGGSVPGGFAFSCTGSLDCDTEICVPLTTSIARCSGECSVDTDCPTGWMCDEVSGIAGEVCSCTFRSDVDLCNGFDDNCDGRVDELSGVEAGCAVGETCTGGVCGCAPENSCGGTACVDLARDPNNCGACGSVCPSGVCFDSVCCAESPRTSRRLDLLLAFDNSNSMGEEQASFAADLPRLMRILASGDFNEDGDNTDPEDIVPVDSLNVGVVTSDMGTGGFTVPTCLRSDFGDDAILRTQGAAAMTGCMATYPTFLTYAPAGGTSPDQFAADVACVVVAGTRGCGFEQQLESVLKALSPTVATASTAPDYVAPEFFRATLGHGDRDNDGFLRPDSILGIILVSDEDDCSAQNPELFNPDSTSFPTDLNLRCFAHDEALHPLSRYIDGIRQLRLSPRDIVYVPIVGVPADLSGASYGEILADPRMEERIDSTMTSRLVPSCKTVGTGLAFPPRRIVGVGQGLDALGVVTSAQSICQTSYRSAIDAFLTAFAAPAVSCPGF